MHGLSLFVSPVSRIQEDSTEFGCHHQDGLGEESDRVERRAFPVIGDLRRSPIDFGKSNNNGRDVALTTKLRQALAKSSYGMADIQCVIDSSTVKLFGIVKSYFALQMAIQLARGVAATRRIQLNVDVVPKLYEEATVQIPND